MAWNKQVKDQLIARINNNPDEVLSVFKKENVNLSSDEVSLIKSGNINSSLEERFSTKILGLLGIKIDKF